jgi:hypothetical protein
MSNCHTRCSIKWGVKGRHSSTSSSRPFNWSCMTLWTRISMTFSCSRTPSSLVRVVRNRGENRNCGSEICTAHTIALLNVPHGAEYGPGVIVGLGHPHEERVLQRTTRGSNNLRVFLISNTQTENLLRRSDGWTTLSPTREPVSVLPTGL